MSRRKYSVSILVCRKCNAKMYIPRTNKREKNHIKDIYCYKCKRVEKFIEKGDYK